MIESKMRTAIDVCKMWLSKSIELTDAHIIEIQNSTAMIIVGVIFLIAGDRLHGQNPAAWQMFEALPQMLWGVIYAGAGVTHLACLRWRHDRLRKWTLLAKAGLWIFLGTALWVGVGWYPPAVWIYYLFAAVAFRGYFKLALRER